MHLLRVRGTLWAEFGSKNEKRGYFQDFYFSLAGSKPSKKRFQEYFILSKCHKFSLSYEPFSILCDIL